ncbi:sialate O-acetylesterase [Marilutibacter chinensis]|uniref:Beta galactosidase jelly roll domain-containing protein n=1 Tax=Marilutibacter chinensis TaxID=2912247 RepID=A0ABS9HMZ5_9GAMM|nr:sialate O-acetylesterase [Lysobacter chinensis]MCF7220389.1 beta galactosidase jelly roll domain-containing protein [Lysobacter chinensis]
MSRVGLVRILATLTFIALVPLLSAHAVELPLLFSDGAVLQRDRPLPVWGRAKPGAGIAVEFDGHRVETAATAAGEWRVELPAHAAGGPYELVVQERGGGTVRVRDVLVGDVWLASGQSNMEWPLLQTDGAEVEIAHADDPMIRHFKVPISWSEKPEARLAGGAWIAASPQTAGEFSAVAYHFAREVREATGVPIGIINSTWGGSAIEAWMGLDMLGIDVATVAEKIRQKRVVYDEAEAKTRAMIARWSDTPPAMRDADWAATGLDESDWADLRVPASWESRGYAGMDGVAWYRTTFQLSAREAEGDLELGVGQIDDSDSVWVNGRRVGGMEQSWNVPRRYVVPAEALRPGSNTIAVKVTDLGGNGGIAGSVDQVYLRPAGGSQRSLAGEWKFRTVEVSVAVQGDKNQIETLLYNAMIHPLQPYPLCGVIWYQGEANAYPGGDRRYRDLFAAMIRGWRAEWNAPELPFLWAQLTSWISAGDTTDALGNVQSPWAVLRESQTATLALPATAQAVIIDVGDAHDIHPRDKRTVGHRLALAARHVAYGEELTYAGPMYRSMSTRGSRAVLHFDLQGSALAVRDGGDAVSGFEVAGTDRIFHPAQARIVDDTVEVWSTHVSTPAAVRYAWRDNPEGANLTNREGLPASPFRTVEW